MSQKKQCPYCNKWFRPASFAKHEPACAVRPSDQDLLDMRLAGMTKQEMADDVGVSSATIAAWLKEAKIEIELVPNRKKGRVKVYPRKALRYGQEGGCGRCEDAALCDELQRAGRIVRCEAPDDGDLRNEQARLNGEPMPRPTYSVSIWETVFTAFGGRG